MLSQQKQRLRQQAQDQVRSLMPAKRAALSLLVRDRAIALIGGRYSAVALYWASDLEVATIGIIDFLQQQSAALYLPAVIGDGLMEFRFWEGGALTQDQQHIFCPAAGSPTCTATSFDLMILPLRGFDLQGQRLGTGGGYYDRFLSEAQRPPLLGLAFDEQKLDEIPTEATDVQLDAVITPTAVHCFTDKLDAL